MKFPTSLMAGLALAAVTLCGNQLQAQTTITGIYPDGARQFEASPTLSFTASSAAGVTNVTVKLTVTSLYNGQSYQKSLTAANGLAITGPTNSLSVSAVLNSNTLYSAAIQAKSSDGSVANQTVNFDTITPAYTFEAEDWNYGGGMFIDNPQTNAYANLGTGSGDAQNSNGNADYRPIDPGLSTEANGDIPRSPWIGSGLTDYDVGFTDTGDYGNYTRTFPAGTYNLFARVSGGNGPRTEVADVSVVGGTATINSDGNSPYKFGTQGRGWQTYDFMPVTDDAGNLVQITFDGTPSTLQILQNEANDNLNFFMLMPIDTNVLVSTVTITNVTPDGSSLYNSAGTFSFNAYSPSAPVDAANILVEVTATNLWGQGSVSSLTASDGLTVTGPTTNLDISFPTTTNTIYSVLIQIIDANGAPLSATYSFDTIIPTYTFEAEDFDYGSGQFIDNPQTNAYFGLDGQAEIDFHATQHGGDYNRIGLTTEGASDKTRPAYDGTGMVDYDVGFNDGGNWGNYTRHYPAGVYNIYVRASNGGGNGSADSGSFSIVTGGFGTSSQTLVELGKWGVPSTGGWQTYQWVPVKDPAGNLAQFTSNGSTNTLRMTIDGGNCNENFFLLTPADPDVQLQPYVDNIQPDGSAMFQPSNMLSFVVHSQPGTDTGNIILNLNGVNVSGLSFSGTPQIRTATYPLEPNMYYTAIITVTDANGMVSVTNDFATFYSTNYQWEAEDYDYNGGSYYDNPQVNSYLNLGSIAGIDNVQSDLSAQPFNYRLTSVDDPAPSTTTSGDQARDQLAGGTDYNIGFFGGGSWCNYTRHYPAGTYNVIGRFAEGASLTAATLSVVTSGAGTTNQTVSQLGTFTIQPMGWGTWAWAPLKDGNGNLAKVELSGSETTLRLGGTTVAEQPEVNVNFLMLVPTIPSPELAATIVNGNINISFMTQSGYSYQLEYKNSLTDSTWTPLGGALSGSDAVQTSSDAAANSNRFYRVAIQKQ